MSRVRLLGFFVMLVGASEAAAQQLPLKRWLPSLAWEGCPPPDQPQAPVTLAQREQAERFAEAATQASLLGDKATALDLLTRAANVDPSSKTIAYHLARTLDEQNRVNDALVAYCRYLALAPDAPDAQEVRDRTRVLGTPVGFAVTAAAMRAYETGIVQYVGGNLAAADTAFDKAIAAAPAWSDAIYNRGVTRLALGRTDAAAADLRRYLELSPGALDFKVVQDRLATSRPTTGRTASVDQRLKIAPTDVSFSAVQNGATPGDRIVSVTNAGSGTLSSLSATVRYPQGQPSGWLIATLAATTAPTTLVLSATQGNIPAGTYTATVDVSTTTGTAPLTVRLTVLPPTQ